MCLLQAIKEGLSREEATSTFQFFDELDHIFNLSGAPPSILMHSEQPEDGESCLHVLLLFFRKCSMPMIKMFITKA